MNTNNINHKSLTRNQLPNDLVINYLSDYLNMEDIINWSLTNKNYWKVSCSAKFWERRLLILKCKSKFPFNIESTFNISKEISKLLYPLKYVNPLFERLNLDKLTYFKSLFTTKLKETDLTLNKKFYNAVCDNDYALIKILWDDVEDLNYGLKGTGKTENLELFNRFLKYGANVILLPLKESILNKKMRMTEYILNNYVFNINSALHQDNLLGYMHQDNLLGYMHQDYKPEKKDDFIINEEYSVIISDLIVSSYNLDEKILREIES
jgi:hypothetical protein